MNDSNNQQHSTIQETNEEAIIRSLSSVTSRSVTSAPGADKAEERAEALHALKVKDHDWKLKARKNYGLFFAILLCVQNAAVYVLMFWAFFTDKLDRTPVSYAFMITGTLAETYLIIKIIVQWLFSDIKYKDS